MKILLMGNGSSVMDNEFGEKIDNDFDLVYRINRFKTNGYEKNVGTKVDAWFLADNGVQWLENENEKIEGSSRWNEFGYVYFVSPKFKHNINLQTDECQRVLRFCNQYEDIQLLPSQLEDDINSVVDFSPAWPTSGLIAIQFLTNSYHQVYIHGFDGHSKEYKYIHYYDTKETRTSEHAWRSGRTDHNLQKEKDYLDYLVKQKKVIRLEDE